MRWNSYILTASKVATIAFTLTDAEKAAVLNEKNQLLEVPGILNEAVGATNAPIMAKEAPMKAHLVEWKGNCKKELNSLTEW